MVEIRRAIPNDAEKILDCLKIIGGETDNLTFGSEGVPMTVERERTYLESILSSEKQIYLVACNGGEIIGTASLSCSARPRLSHRGEISITVKRSMWGKHIGSQLMEKIIDFAKNTAKIEIISLEVRNDNSRAIALYKKFGFEKIGTFPALMKINGENIDCDIMVLDLKKSS